MDTHTTAVKLSRRSAVKGLALGVGLPFLSSSLGAKIVGADLHDSPTATTSAGKVRGFIDNEIRVFKGIPYGADTAPRWFMAPIPPEPWTGIRPTLQFGPRAPQMRPPARVSAAGSVVDPGGPVSEDCLYLNVWTPGLRDGAKRPFMFYIHGGGFVAHAANFPIYDGVNLCRRGDVVVVTLNHRLNAFGYLYLAELGGTEFADSGNLGQLDLVLALQWVRENIAEFGGDPNRVLIFGESGGGGKVATLMAMPLAVSLFQRAATSSGEAVTALDPQQATWRAEAVMNALGLPLDQINKIRTVSIDYLITASRASEDYGPVVDGHTLSRIPFTPDAPQLSAHIPFMVGTNHDESRALIGENDQALFSLTWETLKQSLGPYSQKMGDLNRMIYLYRRSHPDYSASDVFFAATTDSHDWRPAVIEIEHRAAFPQGSAPTYSYELRWGSPIDNGKYKACHGLDLALIFDNIALSHRMNGESSDAYALSGQMSEAYITFARNGNPNHSKIPYWPPYDLSHRATLAFDLTPTVIDDPRAEERKFFSFRTTLLRIKQELPTAALPMSSGRRVRVQASCCIREILWNSGSFFCTAVLFFRLAHVFRLARTLRPPERSRISTSTGSRPHMSVLSLYGIEPPPSGGPMLWLSGMAVLARCSSVA
jgi:para-nitrobenzyl esterase